MTFTKPLEFSVNHEAFYDEETGETDEDKLGQFTEIVSDFRSQFASNKLGLDEYEEFLKTYGDYLTIEKPSFSDNMKFMFEYQFGYMYFRYLMWNFVGKQNDLQGNYESLEGNWLSGISFIDNLHLDNQSELTTDMKNNKGRTIKDRIKLEQPNLEDNFSSAFVQTKTPFQTADLRPSIWVEYQRLTLVGKHQQERVTLDLQLTFSNENQNKAFINLN